MGESLRPRLSNEKKVKDLHSGDLCFFYMQQLKQMFGRTLKERNEELSPEKFFMAL